ncbi:MAG: 16S rRNA (cytosine(1402)-N(4))-methyltransferase RsmH [Planctomycetota bacterium]
MAETIGHTPVLLEESLELLAPQPGATIVDATVGRGGHTLALLQQVGKGGRVVGFDLDADNLAFASRRVEQADGQFVPIHASFVRVAEELRSRGIVADGLLADLGVASVHLDEADRGFSFTHDGPLDMRLDRSGGTTAADLLARISERELANLIYSFGEDPFARKIARKLIHAREVRPIVTTAQLAQLVSEAYGSRARESRLHPATRTFMALRIAVNDELSALDALLDSIRRQIEAPDEARWLSAGARVAIISFHSLEDRQVKRGFAAMAASGTVERLTKKPCVASDTETRQNPRARSAKLRAIEFRASRRDDPSSENDRT